MESWNGRSNEQAYPELFSFAKNPWIPLHSFVMLNPMTDHFHLPLSIQAYQQFLQLKQLTLPVQHQDDRDIWTYNWGSPVFSTAKAYLALIGQHHPHPTFRWLWLSKCQMKHKIFFWLLLSTRDLLHRRNMDLDSFTWDLCILQRLETSAHLFIRCNFAKACWSAIGIQVAPTRNVKQNFNRRRQQLRLPFFMEIIILMCWCVWSARNDWVFRNIVPRVDRSMRRFIDELLLLKHRTKPNLFVTIEDWIASLP